jgi:hypothetical protein
VGFPSLRYALTGCSSGLLRWEGCLGPRLPLGGRTGNASARLVRDTTTLFDLTSGLWPRNASRPRRPALWRQRRALRTFCKVKSGPRLTLVSLLVLLPIVFSCCGYPRRVRCWLRVYSMFVVCCCQGIAATPG